MVRQLEELGQDNKERDCDADDLGALKIEGIDLRAQPRGEVSILNLLEAGAIDVPDAALPDVS